MYQMLTGVLPYDTPSPADLDRLMRGELLTRAAPEEPEDPEGDQRHRPEGDGAGDPRAATSAPASCSTTCWRRASAAAHAATPHAGGRRRPPTTTRRTSTSGSRRAKRRSRASAGTAASRSTPARIAARSAAKRSNTMRIGEWRANRRFSQSPTRRCTRMLESREGAHDGVSGHGQDLDERQARRVEGRDDPHRVARHPLRQRRVRRRALLRDAEGLGLLPSGRAHAPAAALRQDLPDGVPARPGRLAAARCSRRSAPTR